MPGPRTVRMIAQDVQARAERTMGRLGLRNSQWNQEQHEELREVVDMVKALAQAVEMLDAPGVDPTPLRSVP
jgi:hypothetical protein